MAEPGSGPRVGAGPRIETAAFEPMRVGGRRGGRTPLVAGGWLLAVAAVVALGLSGQDGNARPTEAPLTVRLPVATVAQPRPPGPARTSDPNPIVLQVQPLPTGLGVSGTISAHSVVWVFVSVRDSQGTVQSWRSVSTADPMANGGLRPDFSPAFDVQLTFPAPAAGELLWVEANAYNALGRKIGSVRQPFGGPGEPIRLMSQLVR